MQVTEQLSSLIAGAGYEQGEPVVAGVHGPSGPPVFAAQGMTRAGEPAGPDTLAYAASLSKQITAGCLALLVHDGALDMEDTLARRLPGLPAWARTVRLRHLLHHTAGLPNAQLDADAFAAAAPDLTDDVVLSVLAQVPALAAQPGTVHEYSNVGYTCLATVAARAAGQPLPEFAARRVFAPLGMDSTRFWTGPAPVPPGLNGGRAAPLAAAHPAPLTLGAGGAWSTARDLLRWGHAFNADELGISGLMQAEGTLDDGTPVGYAWGMGVRSHAGYRVYRHGGGYPGLRALLALVPDLHQSLIIIAMADDSERRVNLADSMLDLVTLPLPELS